MHVLKKVLDTVLKWIVVVLFALLVIVVVWQVFSRQVLSDPATWTEEGARMTFVWVGLFAAALVFGERGHIAVEVVVRKFSPNGQKIMGIIVQIAVLAFALLLLVWGGSRAAGNAWNQSLSALPFTMGQMYLALPISGVLIAFYSLYYLVAIAIGAEPAYEADEDEEFIESQISVRGEVETVLGDDAPGEDLFPSEDNDRKKGDK